LKFDPTAINRGVSLKVIITVTVGSNFNSPNSELDKLNRKRSGEDPFPNSISKRRKTYELFFVLKRDWAVN